MEHQKAYPGAGENTPAEANVEEQATAAHWSPFAAAEGGEETAAQHVTPPREAAAAQPPGGYQQPTQSQQHAVPPSVYGVNQPQSVERQSSTQQHPVVAPAPNGPQFWDPQLQQQQQQPPQQQQQAPQPPVQPVSAPPPVVQQPLTAPQSPATPQMPTGNALPVPYPENPPGTVETVGVTADDFARRRELVPEKPVAATGPRSVLRKGTFGLVAMAPGKREREVSRATEAVRRNFGGLRQITVVNPKGGAGKTVAVLMLAMMFGQRRGGYVLAWDNNETQGTLGMRAQQDFHHRTVRDLLRDLDHFRGPTGRVGDLSQYVRSQGEAMFDVLSSDESATAGEMLTSQAFGNIREVVSRFYKLIVVDTGNNVRAQNWQSSIDATDQLVVTMSARNDSAETAARMLDHLEQSGRRELVRQAVSVVSMPAHRKELDLPAVQRHFSARTRAVLLAPYEKLLDSGEPIRYGSLAQSTKDAWLKVAASVAEGL